MKWQKKLNKKELSHLRENKMHTLQDMRENREKQRSLMERSTNGGEICWDCKIIAQKLGIES